ncbi:hypothetical protein GCM10027445_40710 [Amycolatopsis endophytica]
MTAMGVLVTRAVRAGRRRRFDGRRGSGLLAATPVGRSPTVAAAVRTRVTSALVHDENMF